ncbi:GNAT family N-acetyltransferase [Aureibacillus halotolerans]|uniref:RimJ/RimL family protein N-acetyltransferase n=1 Tax=Aureibacillus halotolerans TaxID=1508390 RepID=A0A4R6UBE7_9BACI|nr:GNAT family protein [Aureibacillus halotolerans]TDQ42289.1 RimJ/RimL family protein N-acetyltransferase [Aureibacillus halotolerans]
MSRKLYTERLILLPCSVHFAKSIILYLKELRVRSPVLIPPQWPPVQLKMFLPFYLEALEKGKKDTYFWVLIKADSAEIIGEIVLIPKKDQHGVIELSYRIEETHRRQGYGYEAVNEVCSYISTQKNVRIIAETAEGNLASERLLMKAGLRLTLQQKDFKQWELM